MTPEIQDGIRAQGGSMAPFIPPGSTFSVERVPPEDIQKGDVICYIDEFGVGVAHRVIQKTRNQDGIEFTAKGDARDYVETIPPESVTFVVRRVNYRGLSYDTHSLTGRVIAKIALEESRKAQMTKRLCNHLWRLSCWAVRTSRTLLK